MVNSQVLNKGLQQKNWYIIDASTSTLGRLATEISKILIGKHKSNYAPYLDNGDCVIVINASHIKVTGKKETQKLYYNHSGYPGGMRVEQFVSLKERFPEKILERAIRGMLPKNALGRKIFRNVKIYKYTDHPHYSQNPKFIKIIN
jgi:large subunit ribosomal protein L13